MNCAECYSVAAVKGLCKVHYKRKWAKAWNMENKELASKRRRAWDASNRDRVNETRRRSYRRRKTQENAASREYYNNHKKEIFARLEKTRGHRSIIARQWRLENPDKANKASKQWAERNPEKSKALRVRRRARKAQAAGCHNADQIKNLFQLQRGRCAICTITLPKRYHEDHIIPLFRGGNDWISNIQLTCGSCNVRKHAKDPIIFMQERGFLL